MSPGTANVSFTLPVVLAHDIESVASTLGITQSALVSELLGETLQVMVACFRDLAPEPTPAGARRARGRSIDLIHASVAQALALARDINTAQFRDEVRSE